MSGWRLGVNMAVAVAVVVVAAVFLRGMDWDLLDEDLEGFYCCG